MTSSLLHYIFVKVCKNDQRKHYILGSYALRGIRNINDLDINLDAAEFMKVEEATRRGWGRIEVLQWSNSVVLRPHKAVQ